MKIHRKESRQSQGYRSNKFILRRRKKEIISVDLSSLFPNPISSRKREKKKRKEERKKEEEKTKESKC